MKRSAFTMIELLLAVMLVGVLTTISVFTFNSVSRGWQISTDYMDKMQRTDFALNQVISGLRSMYYPHDGKQDDRYGFTLTNNGDGDDPDSSDIIEWSKTGSAIEGNNDYRSEVEVTGLYARQCPDVALRPKDNPDDIDYSFANDEMYQPVLIADGVVGFNCRVLKTAEEVTAENDDRAFEDEFAESNAVPYKVELTFRISDPEGRSYRTNTAPLMRIIRIPIHEQSLDGSVTPSDAKEKGRK